MYALNGIDFTSYGLFPSRADNSTLAMSGFLDLPARIGKAYHDWGDENGIDPYINPDQMFFGGRTINLFMFLNASGKADAINKVNTFFDAVDAFTGLVPLLSDWYTTPFLVYVSEVVEVVHFRNGKAKVKLTFRQPVCDLSSTSPDSEGATYGINGVSWATLGLMPLTFTNTMNRPAPKEQFFKSYETEGFQITKRKERVMTLTCLIKESSLSAFVERGIFLQNFFCQSGLMLVKYQSDSSRLGLIKDGFTIKNIIARVKESPLLLLDADAGVIFTSDDPFSELIISLDWAGTITALLTINITEV